jgi:hypothetical protein
VHRVGPEPEVVLSADQWTAITKAIGLDKTPLGGKRDICAAILAYHHARIANERANDEAGGKPTRRQVDPRAKGRAALSNFNKYTRGLRHALESVETHLKKHDLISEAERLREGIYKFEKLAKHELDKKSAGGRPQLQMRDELVYRLAIIYFQCTHKMPTRTGAFSRFTRAIFRAQGISEVGLSNAMAKAVRAVKNQQ